MHEWARATDWDQTDPDDVLPVHMNPAVGSLRDRTRGDAQPAFFDEWGRHLQWPDEAMLGQAGRHGVVSGAWMRRDTVFMYHHTGLRKNMAPALELVAQEEAAGRVTTGWAHPPIIPFRMVAYNCVSQHKWKLQGDSLTYVEKWRVTTDDSIAAAGSDSRNDAIARESWPDHNLCAPQHLGRAVAIMKAAREPPASLSEAAAQAHEAAGRQGARLSQGAAERVALWALDLSDAYRVLSVHWSELWMQGFIWLDGARVNLRCLFGTAHMVGFFQRVSLFILAVARELMAEYDATVPPDEGVRRWMATRGERVAGYQMVYIDDILAASFVAGDRPLRTQRRERTLAGVESRAQAQQRIARRACQRAGWQVQRKKLQMGFSIEALGVGVDTGDEPGAEGPGALFCPEAKRRGLISEIDALLPDRRLSKRVRAQRSVDRAPVDTLVGRCSHISQLEPAANAHMRPMYAVVRAERGNGDYPRRLHVWGECETQLAFQGALAWWRATLDRGLRVPLAAQKSFPALTQPGVVACFSDAAREDGTGLAGWAVVDTAERTRPTFFYLEARWPTGLLHALQADSLSMPAGEMVGIAAIALAVMKRLGGVTDVYSFTDASAAQAAINSGSSGSRQLHALLVWLFDRAGDTQFLALHQQGKRNWAADALSRDGHGGSTIREVLQAAEAADLEIERLDLPDGLWDAAKHAATLAQRAWRADSQAS